MAHWQSVHVYHRGKVHRGRLSKASAEYAPFYPPECPVALVNSQSLAASLKSLPSQTRSTQVDSAIPAIVTQQ